jgi:hypothetical protein
VPAPVSTRSSIVAAPTASVVTGAQDDVAQLAGARPLVVGRDARAVEQGRERRRGVVQRRLGDAAARQVDDVVRARRVCPQHQTAVRARGHQLRSVAVAERSRRGDAFADRDVDPRQRARHPGVLPRELRAVVEVLEHAAAARPERAARRRPPRGRRRLDGRQPRPRLGSVGRHVLDHGRDALVRQRARDVEAGLVARGRQARPVVVQVDAGDGDALAGLHGRYLAGGAPIAAASFGSETS